LTFTHNSPRNLVSQKTGGTRIKNQCSTLITTTMKQIFLSTQTEAVATELEIGQIFFLNGYGQDEYNHERKAIYKKEQGQFGLKYHFVNLDKPQLGIKSAAEIRPLASKRGNTIGSYYKHGDMATQEEIQTAIEAAGVQQAQAAQIQDEQATAKAAAIERGKAIFAEHKPTEAVGYIIATFQEDQSDRQSDYYGSKTTKRVILSWTMSKRENFNEMRKACLNTDIEEIRILNTAPENFEHRQNYTGGGGYFLAEDRYSGWKLRKVVFYNDKISDDAYEIAGTQNGFYAFNNKQQLPAINTAPADPTSTKTESPKQTDVSVIDYSEKAIAVVGNTKPIKDILSAANGRFNARLRDAEGKIFAGWIFSKKHREKVESILKGL
jgi:hypothetical protein